MSLSSECPGLEALRALAVGQLEQSRAHEVQTHLTACPACAETTRALEEWAGFEKTGVFEDGPGGAPPEDDSATVLAREDEILAAADLDLSFLAPSVCHHSIGRIGPYEAVSLLGRGGMGLVFKGLDQSLGRTVAVKVLSPRLATSSRARRRFLREARAAAAISHANVVTLHGVGVHRGLPYLVMQYIDGRSLRQRLRREPSLRLDEVVRIVVQVLDGLIAAHHHGVIHRDVNPANIMLEGDLERVKITDFGLARVASGVSGLTSVDQIIGTPAFMSPEQVMGEPIDTRTDLFSLGCVIYAMVAGQSPFKGGHPLEIIRKVREWTPPPLIEAAPECPVILSDLVGRLMAKTPSDRFASASGVLQALRPLLVASNLSDSAEGYPSVTIPREPTAEPPVSPPAGDPPPPSESSPDPLPSPPPRRRSGARLAAVGAFAVVLLGLGTWSRPWVPRLFAPSEPTVWTVGRSLPGALPSLAAALDRAGPGDLVRIVDNETYDGQVWIDDPDHWHDLTIEAAPGASPILVASNGPSVVTIQNVPGVLLRGLTLRARPDQSSVRLSGPVEGVLLEALRSQKPLASTAPHVLIEPGTRGALARPISIHKCRFSGGSTGLDAEGALAAPVRFLVVEDNCFRNLDVHLSLKTCLRDVRIAGNRFSGGNTALRINVPPLRADRLTIDHNSVFAVHRWLDPADSDPAQKQVVISRNAVFEPLSSDQENQRRLLAMARLGWRFEANLQENPRSAVSSDSPISRQVDHLAVRSRDPDHPRFLHPSPGSHLSGDAPGDYIGALPPSRD